ncbi:MAG TPA: tetratricopeptide repeat protein [Candidatus Obscuribacterales bacterium]
MSERVGSQGVQATTKAGARDSKLLTSQSSRKPPEGASVEWDFKGRVIRSRFSNGHICQFRYDHQGMLCAFTYADLAWSTTDGARWTAVDQDNTYVLDGTVDIGLDGTIRIERLDICRRIRLNGAVTDQLADGTAVEVATSMRTLSFNDLLATVKAKATDLPVQSPARNTNEGLAPHLVTGSSDMPDNEETVDLPRRKFIAQGMRIKNMRQMLDEDAGMPPPAADQKMRPFSSLRKFYTDAKIRLLQIANGAEDISIVPSIDELAFQAHAERRIDEARMLHERALQLRRRTLGYKHPDLGISMFGLGKIYHEWGRTSEAEQYYLQAIRLFEYGFKKARFMLEVDAAKVQYVGHALGRYITALQALAALYHEQGMKHLIEQLRGAAESACQSVQVDYPSSIDASVEAITMMAARLEMNKRPADTLRTSRWERHSGV